MAISTLRWFSFLGLLAALPGCGFVRIASGGASAPGGASAEGAPATSGHGSVAAAYAGWTYESCHKKTLFECGALFAQQAGDPYRPDANPGYEGDPAGEASPDAVWLPGWSKLPRGASHADSAYAALHVAASEKTWRSACDALFDTYRDAQKARLDAVRPAIAAALAKTNPYERLQALIDIPRPEPTTPADAARFELETATAKAYLDAGRGVSYGEAKLRPEKTPRALFDDATERDAFCIAVAHGQVNVVKDRVAQPVLPAPVGAGGDALLAGVVKPLFTAEREKEIADATARARQATDDLFAMRDAPRPPSHLGGKVKSAEHEGDTWTVTLYEEASGVHQDESRCVAVNLVVARCPTVNTKEETTTHLTFVGLPSDVSIVKGDELSLWGREDGRKSKTTHRATEVVEEVDVAFTPAFLDGVSHDGRWTSLPEVRERKAPRSKGR